MRGIIQTGAWVFPPDMFDRAERLFQKSEVEVQLRTLVHEYIREGIMTATMLPPDSFLDLGTYGALQKGGELLGERKMVRMK